MRMHFRARFLSPLEKQIAGLVSEGLANAEIAQQLGFAEQTVKKHVHNIYRKLKVNHRQAVARLCKEPHH